MATNFLKVQKGLNLAPQSGTPSTPVNGDLYYDSSLSKFRKYQNGTWSDLSSGGAGGTKNYLAAMTASLGSGVANTGNGDFELGTTAGFSLAHSALTSLFPTSVASAGTAFDASHGGTAASGNLSFSAISSSQLAGSFSGSLVSSAASTAGDMLISDAFFIDAEDQAKMMAFSFSYKAVSGTFNFSGTSANTYAVYIYDVSNAVWIQPFGLYNLVQASGVGTCSGNFQTSANGIKYQIAIININATAGAYSFSVDDFNIGRQAYFTGGVATDWQSYTPTFGPAWGTVTNVNVFWRRVGDTLEVQGTVTSGPGSGGTGGSKIGLPAGLSMDQTKMHNLQSVGSIQGLRVSGTNQQYPDISYGPWSLWNENGFADGPRASNHINSNQFDDFLNGDSNANYTFYFRVPIVGWASNVQLSSDADLRTVGLVFTGVFTGSIAASAPIPFTTSAIKDTHGGYNPSTGQYTAPVTGFYDVSAFLVPNTLGAGQGLNVWVAGVQAARLGITTQTNEDVCGAASIYVLAGQTIDLRSTGTIGGTSGDCSVSIIKAPGSAIVAPAETIAAKYYGDAQTPGAAGQINYNHKIYDTHNLVTGGAGSWKFTAPIAGKYAIKATVTPNTSGSVGYELYKNGASYQELLTAAGSQTYSVSTDIDLVAGDFIDLRTDTSIALYGGTAPFRLVIAIIRIGN